VAPGNASTGPLLADMMAGVDPIATMNPADRAVAVATSEAVAFGYTLAGLGSRILAFALDLLLLALILSAESVATWIAFAALQGFGEAGSVIFPWVAGTLLVVAFATVWGYFIVLEAATSGRTPGKRRLGIRVVREDGGRIGVLDAVVRNVVLLVDLLPGTFAVGIASILLSPRQQRLGDLAAGTIVVLDGGPTPAPPEADPRIRLAREYLERSDRLTPDARVQVGAEILALLDGTGPPADSLSIPARVREIVSASED
jgi:uncharacterized RDD family membrane protein YckC